VQAVLAQGTPRIMPWPHALLFASDATLVGIGATALLALAGAASLAERRRAARKQLDAVGWMPWTGLFLACALCGVALLTLAVQGWIAG
jgi:hypothetical protein